MAAVFVSRSNRLHRSITGDPGTANLGRRSPRPRQSIHKEPAPRTGSVPALSLSRLVLGSLPAGPESVLHVGLLFLEYGPSRVPSQQYSPARSRRPAALSPTYPPVWQTARSLGE